MSKTLFNTNLDEEYVPMAEDLTKMFVILIVVNFLMFISNLNIPRCGFILFCIVLVFGCWVHL